MFRTLQLHFQILVEPCSQILQVFSLVLLLVATFVTWYDADTKTKTRYLGRIEKLKKRKGDVHSCTVGYWNSEESYDSPVDYTVSKYELGEDLICEDLALC